MLNNVAFGFQHDDGHNRGCHHDGSILNPPVIPCKHNKRNKQDANRPERQDVEQRPQCHQRKVVRCTKIKITNKKKEIREKHKTCMKTNSNIMTTDVKFFM